MQRSYGLKNKLASSMRILGIDPGTRITGFGLIAIHSNKAIKALEYGCIRPPSSQALSSRYRIIFNSLLILIKKYCPDAMAVESQYVAKNPQSCIKLGMAKGVVMLAASLQEIPIFEYAPTRVKQAVTGSGKAGKNQVGRMIQQLLALPVVPTPEDASDALAVAICHGHHAGYSSCTPI